MAMFAPYKFVGILNMFDVCPDFVYTIFERDGVYYFQDADEKNGKIKDFVPVKQDAIRLVQKLDNFEVSNIPNCSFCLGSDALLAFQLDDSHLQVGTITELKNFLATYETKNDFLKEEIQAFFEECKDS